MCRLCSKCYCRVKYDDTLREEAEVELNEEGKFQVTVTRIGKHSWTDNLGEFDTYDEARQALYDNFDKLFNRPSANAINSGANPNWKVWDIDAWNNGRPHDHPAQEVKRSISIVEGDEAKAVLGMKVEEYMPSKAPRRQVVRIPTVGIPSVITIRTLYPAYFKHKEKAQAHRKARMRRLRERK